MAVKTTAPGSRGRDAVSEKPLQIAFVAGEPSGDRQGAALMTALRDLAAPRVVEAWGIGGHHMAEAGVRITRDSGPWASIGIAEVLGKLPMLLWVRGEFKRALKKNPPDALVVIDAGGFNVPLARWAKQNHICPVFYYFPPGSWRRDARVQTGKRNLAEAADTIVTPFPWSAATLQAGGANAHFLGHPLLDLVKATLADDDFYTRFGLDPHRPVVALLPGSRRQEIQHILPPLLSGADEISRRIPGVQFVVALASEGVRPMTEALIRREQREGGRAARLQLLMAQAGNTLAHLAQNSLPPATVPALATIEGIPVTMPEPPVDAPEARPVPAHSGPAPLVICTGLTWDVLARSDLVLTKSGTATLEAMILKKPMVIVYHGSKLMAVEWKLRRRQLNLAHIGLPNILAEERVFAELMGDEATPEAIADLSMDLLLDPSRILALKEKLGELVPANLGEPGGVRRAATLLLELIDSRTNL